MSTLHISISAETIAHIGSMPFSNSMLTSVVVSGVIILFALAVNRGLKKEGKFSRMQMFAELIVEGLYQLCLDITNSTKKARKFAPFIISFFLFIVLNNWAGLLPGVGTIGMREGGEAKHEEAVNKFIPKALASTPEVVKTPDGNESPDTNQTEITETEVKSEGVFVPFFRAGTADLNTTLALAVISVVATQALGIGALGASYFKKYLNFSSPIMFFVGILETILETAKIVSFAFRLFGNIFAGEVLLTVMMFLVPIIIPMPFYGLEIFVGLIQGLVFSMLTLVFFNLATIGHEEHEASAH